MSRRVAASVVAAALIGAVACKHVAPTGPPEIRLGMDACDGCGMTIAETRYAAGAIAEGDSELRILKFDDIGCLARWEARASGSVVQRRWVHDRISEEWIDADTATFARLAELATPMGSGLAAFRVASDAEGLVASRGGQTLTWAAILAQSREGSR